MNFPIFYVTAWKKTKLEELPKALTKIEKQNRNIHSITIKKEINKF